MTRNAYPDKYKCSGYSYGFFHHKVIVGCVKTLIFGADINSLVHIDNKKKDILNPGKDPTDGLDYTMSTTKKEYSINFTEQKQTFCLRSHNNGMNRYLFVNDVKNYKFKAKDSEINAAPLCLGNASKDFPVDNTKKRLDYMDMTTILKLIMIVLMLMIF